MALPAFSTIEICQKFACSPKAMELASQFTKPSEFITQLRAENMGQEAVQSLSRMMPKEKAVEWAEQSARMAGEKAGLSEEEVKALDAARAWAANPTEAARRKVETAREGLPANSPAVWAANAAAFSEPMPLPEDAAPLSMADDLTAQMAAGSVQLSAAKMSPTGVPEVATVLEMPEMPEMSLEQSADPDLQQVALEQASETMPEQQTQATKLLDPFLDMGVKLAESVPGWS